MTTDDKPFGTASLSDGRLDEASVHNLRKGTKQLRARLQLLRQLEGQHQESEQLRRAVKELARLLAAQRDADVMSSLLQDLILATEDLEVQQLLAALRSDLRPQAPSGNDRRRIHKLVREIEKTTPRLLQDKPTEAELDRILLPRFAALCAAGSALLPGEDWEALHDWRKQVKKLMYQYHLKSSLTPKDLFVLEHLDTIGAKLGNINDLCMLDSFVNSHQAKATRVHTLDVYGKVHDLITARRDYELSACRSVFQEISNLQ